jgi:hypothetical protein
MPPGSTTGNSWNPCLHYELCHKCFCAKKNQTLQTLPNTVLPTLTNRLAHASMVFQLPSAPHFAVGVPMKPLLQLPLQMPPAGVTPQLILPPLTTTADAGKLGHTAHTHWHAKNDYHYFENNPSLRVDTPRHVMPAAIACLQHQECMAHDHAIQGQIFCSDDKSNIM